MSSCLLKVGPAGHRAEKRTGGEYTASTRQSKEMRRAASAQKRQRLRQLAHALECAGSRRECSRAWPRGASGSIH
eukprot:2900870-Pleurochrysis_carterae.AAC.2